MNRTEAKSVAVSVRDLEFAEQLGQELVAADGRQQPIPFAASVFGSLSLAKLSPTMNEAVSGIANEAARKIVDVARAEAKLTAAALGIDDYEFPIDAPKADADAASDTSAANDATAAATADGTGVPAEQAGTLTAEPQTTALGEAGDPPAAPAEPAAAEPAPAEAGTAAAA